MGDSEGEFWVSNCMGGLTVGEEEGTEHGMGLKKTLTNRVASVAVTMSVIV